MSDVDAEVARLRSELCAASDSELATMLGLGRSAVSQWRKRGAVPESARTKAAMVAAHLRSFANAAGQVASLPLADLIHARGLAIAFTYSCSLKGPEQQETVLARYAGAFDQVTIAAAAALRRFAGEHGSDLETAFATLMLEANLERAITRGLIPNLLPQ